MNKKIIWSVIGIVVVVLILLGINSNTSSNAVIQLGFVGPLTGDGAVWGVIEKNTIQLAVDEINTAGGVNGKQIQVTYEDGKCDGATGLSAAKKLVEIDHIGILLVSCSQEMESIGPYAEANKIIALTSYATASDITSMGKYIFRNSYTNQDMGQAMADQAFKKGKTAAVLSEQSAFASDLRDKFVADYQNDGGTIVDSENYSQGTRDLRTQVTKIVSLNPAVVVINPNGPDTGIASVQQLRQLRYKGPFIGNFFGGSTEVQKIPEAQGMVYISDPVLADSTLKQKVFAEYAQKYGAAPDLAWPVGARYDAVYILKQAFEAVGDDPTAVMNYLHHMPQEFTGILGTYKFDADDANITNVHPSVAEIENDSSILIK